MAEGAPKRGPGLLELPLPLEPVPERGDDLAWISGGECEAATAPEAIAKLVTFATAGMLAAPATRPV